jgi:hypothetical protein
LTTHEWTGTEKLRRSDERLARYVMPHFRGHTQGYREERRQIQEEARRGRAKLDRGGPSNLAF